MLCLKLWFENGELKKDIIFLEKEKKNKSIMDDRMLDLFANGAKAGKMIYSKEKRRSNNAKKEKGKKDKEKKQNLKKQNLKNANFYINVDNYNVTLDESNLICMPSH